MIKRYVFAILIIANLWILSISTFNSDYVTPKKYYGTIIGKGVLDGGKSHDYPVLAVKIENTDKYIDLYPSFSHYYAYKNGDRIYFYKSDQEIHPTLWKEMQFTIFGIIALMIAILGSVYFGIEMIANLIHYIKIKRTKEIKEND